jgi:hypothetical protein
MSIDRATIKIGPAKLAHDGATHFFPDGLTLTATRTFVDVEVDAYGVLLKAHVDTTLEVSGTPKAWANLAKLNPFGPMLPGTLLCGATDKPLVITPQNGKPLTLAAACVKSPPNLMLSAGKPFFSSGCTWAGVLANNVEWSAAGGRYSYGNEGANVALTGLTLAELAMCPWAATLGGTAFEHEDGIGIDFNIGLTEQRTDSQGVVDWSLDSVEAVAKYVPVGLGEAENLDALGLQGAGVVRGVSAATKVLAITGSGTRAFTLNGCVQRSASPRYGRSVKRVGEVELVSTRGVTGGALNTLYTFA